MRSLGTALLPLWCHFRRVSITRLLLLILRGVLILL